MLRQRLTGGIGSPALPVRTENAREWPRNAELARKFSSFHSRKERSARTFFQRGGDAPAVRQSSAGRESTRSPARELERAHAGKPRARARDISAPERAAEAGRQDVQPRVVTDLPAKFLEKSAPKGSFAPVARERTNFLGFGGDAGEGLRKVRAVLPRSGPALAALWAEKWKCAPLRLGKESPRSRQGGPPGRRARGGRTEI